MHLSLAVIDLLSAPKLRENTVSSGEITAVRQATSAGVLLRLGWRSEIPDAGHERLMAVKRSAD